MMTQQRETSPFSALTYQEQQDRWLEWRSRQLDYCPVVSNKQTDAVLPPLKIPALSVPPQPPKTPAPYRHAQLDQVYSRHQAAVRKASGWQNTLPPSLTPKNI